MALIGPMNITRAVLPVKRKQRSGHVISISSGAGLLGFEFCSAYAASKFGLEGWMESLHSEVAPFGINTIIVNAGLFRLQQMVLISSFSLMMRRTQNNTEINWNEVLLMS
ncbi:short chain dehydrogenase [Paenibacillus sophorae]|nr:SDR family NAD(P)-dependent oxidoreductase [Paenibacillus sophorae]SEP21776.1 short chain dehydrogenase [Paenibacillus sophorae]